jgi:hypothetical protein
MHAGVAQPTCAAVAASPVRRLVTAIALPPAASREGLHLLGHAAGDVGIQPIELVAAADQQRQRGPASPRTAPSSARPPGQSRRRDWLMGSMVSMRRGAAADGNARRRPYRRYRRSGWRGGQGRPGASAHGSGDPIHSACAPAASQSR